MFASDVIPATLHAMFLDGGGGEREREEIS